MYNLYNKTYFRAFSFIFKSNFCSLFIQNLAKIFWHQIVRHDLLVSCGVMKAHLHSSLFYDVPNLFYSAIMNDHATLVARIGRKEDFLES